MSGHTVWVPEKPEMAANLSAGLRRARGVTVLNDGSWRRDGVVRLSDGDLIVPLEGHLTEYESPDVYLRPDDRSRSIFLYGAQPLVEASLKKVIRRPKQDAGADAPGGRPARLFTPERRVGVLQEAMKGAARVVNACDPDREGQAIFDEVMELLGVPPTGLPGLVLERVSLLSAREVDIAGVLLKPLESNSDPKWVRMREAAQVRGRTDWRLGMVMSRGIQSILGIQKIGVGRLQAAIKSMLFRRRTEIAEFKPVTYFIPEITLSDGTVAKWRASKEYAGQEGYDDEGRLIDEGVAAQMLRSIVGGRLEVIRSQLLRESEHPPLPFDGSDLIATVSKRTGHSLTQVQDAAQRLYSVHKAISYIGSNCKYLPKSLREEADQTARAVSRALPASMTMGLDMKLESQAWNDELAQGHHGVIPTGEVPRNLSDVERGVFEAVCQRFLTQFRPPTIRDRHVVELQLGDRVFVAERVDTQRVGWKSGESDPDAVGEVDSEVIYDGDLSKQVDGSTESVQDEFDDFFSERPD